MAAVHPLLVPGLVLGGVAVLTYEVASHLFKKGATPGQHLTTPSAAKKLTPGTAPQAQTTKPQNLKSPSRQLQQDPSGALKSPASALHPSATPTTPSSPSAPPDDPGDDPNDTNGGGSSDDGSVTRSDMPAAVAQGVSADNASDADFSNENETEAAGASDAGGADGADAGDGDDSGASDQVQGDGASTLVPDDTTDDGGDSGEDSSSSGDSDKGYSTLLSDAGAASSLLGGLASIAGPHKRGSVGYRSHVGASAMNNVMVWERHQWVTYQPPGVVSADLPPPPHVAANSGRWHRYDEGIAHGTPSGNPADYPEGVHTGSVGFHSVGGVGPGQIEPLHGLPPPANWENLGSNANPGGMDPERASELAALFGTLRSAWGRSDSGFELRNGSYHFEVGSEWLVTPGLSPNVGLLRYDGKNLYIATSIQTQAASPAYAPAPMSNSGSGSVKVDYLAYPHCPPGCVVFAWRPNSHSVDKINGFWIYGLKNWVVAPPNENHDDGYPAYGSGATIPDPPGSVFDSFWRKMFNGSYEVVRHKLVDEDRMLRSLGIPAGHRGGHWAIVAPGYAVWLDWDNTADDYTPPLLSYPIPMGPSDPARYPQIVAVVPGQPPPAQIYEVPPQADDVNVQVSQSGWGGSTSVDVNADGTQSVNVDVDDGYHGPPVPGPGAGVDVYPAGFGPPVLPPAPPWAAAQFVPDAAYAAQIPTGPIVPFPPPSIPVASQAFLAAAGNPAPAVNAGQGFSEGFAAAIQDDASAMQTPQVVAAAGPDWDDDAVTEATIPTCTLPDGTLGVWCGPEQAWTPYYPGIEFGLPAPEGIASYPDDGSGPGPTPVAVCTIVADGTLGVWSDIEGGWVNYFPGCEVEGVAPPPGSPVY
jgi:hypothetical protein